ncbi:MAG: hypothetical protein U0640_14000 [Phycisphaerales bacterium]
MPASLASSRWYSKGTIALGIETSNPSSVRAAQGAETMLGVAAARCDGVDAGTGEPSWTLLHSEPLRTENPQHDDLAGCIDRCVRAAGLTPRLVNAVCVSIGPGGFTSVRVAVVTAKMICEATGAASVGVPSADVVMFAQMDITAEGCTAVALASKGDNTFVTIYDRNRSTVRAGFLCDAKGLNDIFEKDGVRTLIADQFLPAAMRERASGLGMSVLPPHYSPLACVHAASRHAAIDPAQLLPLYPREPEAVTKWRLLHGTR